MRPSGRPWGTRARAAPRASATTEAGIARLPCRTRQLSPPSPAVLRMSPREEGSSRSRGALRASRGRKAPSAFPGPCARRGRRSPRGPFPGGARRRGRTGGARSRREEDASLSRGPSAPSAASSVEGPEPFGDRPRYMSPCSVPAAACTGLQRPWERPIPKRSRNGYAS